MGSDIPRTWRALHQHKLDSQLITENSLDWERHQQRCKWWGENRMKKKRNKTLSLQRKKKHWADNEQAVGKAAFMSGHMLSFGIRLETWAKPETVAWGWLRDCPGACDDWGEKLFQRDVIVHCQKGSWKSSLPVKPKKGLQECQTQAYLRSKKQGDLLPMPAWQWQTPAPKLPT